MSIKTQASAHALNMPTANSNSLIFFKFFNVSVNWSWNVVILRWIDAAAEILRDWSRGKGDTATLDTLHSQNETQLNSTKAARGGIHWHRVRNHSRGVFSHGMAVWVCFRLSPSTLWSISPGLYNTLKPWGIDTYLNFTQARVLYFCCLNGKCVGWCQMQPSFSALKRDQMTLSNWRVFLASTDGSSLASVSGVKYSRWCLPQTGVVSFFHRYTKKDNAMEKVRFFDSVDRCFDLFNNELWAIYNKQLNPNQVLSTEKLAYRPHEKIH